MANDIVNQFELSRFKYEALTSATALLIRRLLEQNAIDAFAVQARTKELDSLRKKLNSASKSKKYSSLDHITDISGIRVITYLQEDCVAVSDLIKDCFVVDQKNSGDKKLQLDPDKFGYLSDHYVVSLTNSRLELPEFSVFSGMKVEIQVRTILQHSWAVLDHKLRYKNDKEVPAELRRRLFRISALLESADDEFSFLSDKIEALREKYSIAIKDGREKIPINADSIASLLKDSDIIKEILDIVASDTSAFSDDKEDPYPTAIINVAGRLNIQEVSELIDRAKKSLHILRKKWPDIRDYNVSHHEFDTRTSLLRLLMILSSEESEIRRIIKEDIPDADDFEEYYSIVST